MEATWFSRMAVRFMIKATLKSKIQNCLCSSWPTCTLFFGKNWQIFCTLLTFYSDRWKEDYQFLALQPHKNQYEKLKYLPLFKDRNDVYLSLGGNFRERINVYDNDLLGFNPHGDGSQFLHRFLIHADFHATDNFRAFVQLGSFLSNNDGLGTGPFDKDNADLQQGFIDLHYKSLTTCLGRQEFSLGSSRLISVREKAKMYVGLSTVCASYYKAISLTWMCSASKRSL